MENNANTNVMLVQTPDVKHIVQDYDIIFSHGMMLPITINTDLGDTLTVGNLNIIIHLAAKPSPTDPTKTLPAEDITLFTAHIASIQRREREVKELTPDEQLEWKKILQQAGGTVQ